MRQEEYQMGIALNLVPLTAQLQERTQRLLVGGEKHSKVLPTQLIASHNLHIKK
jgi:hypothetical protein